MSRPNMKSPEDFGVDLEMVRRLWADPTVSRKQVVAATGLKRAAFDKMVSRMKGMGKKKFARPNQVQPIRVHYDEARLREMWNGPYSLVEIFTELKVAKSTFAKIIKRLDLGERPKFKPVEYLRLPKEKVEVLLRLYADSAAITLEGIEETHGIAVAYLHQLAEIAGMPRRVRHWKRDDQAEGIPDIKRISHALYTIDRGNPIDPDAKVLMRDFAPVCRATVRDPKAPNDLWIVGQMKIPEQQMRAMAAKRRPAGEEARPW